MRRGLQQAESALEKLINEQTNWAYDKALFPLHSDEIDRVIQIGRRMQDHEESHWLLRRKDHAST